MQDNQTYNQTLYDYTGVLTLDNKPVNFYAGSYTKYKQLQENLGDNCLYFCIDKKVIFRGQEVFPVPYVVLSNKEEFPAAEEAIENIMYFDNESNLGYFYDADNSNFIPKYGENIVHINEIKKIQWNKSTRELQLPQYSNGEFSTLTVDLGQDLILKEAEYHSDTREIWLNFYTANEEDTEESPKNIVKISVDDLVDYDLTKNSNSIALSYVEDEDATGDGNLDKFLKADIIISPDEKNYLTLKENGLYVDVETHVQTVADGLTNKIEAAQSTADLGVENAQKAQNDIDTLNNKVDNSITLGGFPTTNTIAQDLVNLNTKENINVIATTEFVKEAIQYANTWAGLKRSRKTWAELKGSL